MDSKYKLSPLTVIFHWSLAFIIIGLIAMGIYMVRWEQWSYYPVHKSLGLIAFVIIIMRAAWRIRNGWPSPLGDRPAMEQSLARGIHWLLIVCALVQPIFGMLNSGSNGHGFGLFGLELVAANPDPNNPAEVVAHSEFWSKFGHRAHQINGYLLVTLITLHMVAAIKHHIVNRDGTLTRMLGRDIG